MELLQELKESIINGYPKHTEQLTRQLLEQSVSVQAILDEGMIPAMHVLDESYRNNDIFIARILASARAMQTALDILRPYFESNAIQPAGTIILGTVEGDLHDVGKNLVALMLRSSGFTVIDLGVDVSGKRFLKAIKEHPEVSIVCISCLLTTSMPEMARVVKALNRSRARKNFKIMIGGGSVYPKFADEIQADGYSDSAFSAVELAKKLTQERSPS